MKNTEEMKIEKMKNCTLERPVESKQCLDYQKCKTLIKTNIHSAPHN